MKHMLQFLLNLFTFVFAPHLYALKKQRECLKKDIQIAQLGSQLALYHYNIVSKKTPKPRPTTKFRLLWIFFSRFSDSWRDNLILFKPQTVMSWHKKGFRLYWDMISRRGRKKLGHPGISRKIIKLIKQIHKENPLLSPEKIHELLVNLNVENAPAPNTIAKYLPKLRVPPTERQLQSWKTFLHNNNLWSMDFLVVPTRFFKRLYILVIMSHSRREIKHFAVTNHPTSAWVKQQVREATPFGEQPKYLLHDNDSIFTAKDFQEFIEHLEIESVRTSYRSPWQNGLTERLIGTIRREFLDHVIPANQAHLQRLLRKYVYYYNYHRTHQGIDGQTPIKTPSLPPTRAEQTRLEPKPILGGLYNSYKKEEIAA